MQQGDLNSEVPQVQSPGQSHTVSLVESVANVVVGYGVAVATQILIFPTFGLHTTLAQNLKTGAVFTVVSIARSFALRRLCVSDFALNAGLLQRDPSTISALCSEKQPYQPVA